MKKLLLSCLLLIPLLTEAQNCESIRYSEVVTVDSSLSKDVLFNTARRWFANNFGDSKSVLEVSDKATGEMLGKGLFKYHSSIFFANSATSGWIRYTLRLVLKDGRYKIEMDNFEHEANPGNPNPRNLGTISKDFCPAPTNINSPLRWQKRVYEEMLKLSEDEISAIVTSLKDSMKKASKEEDF